MAITHGFSRMQPVRSIQIPPEVVKSPTDFTDIHRFFVGGFGHADFADDADFSSWEFFVPQIPQIFTDFFMESLENRFVHSQGVSVSTEQVASAKIRE